MSPLRIWFYRHDQANAAGVTTVPQWIAKVTRYRSLLGRRKESARRANEELSDIDEGQEEEDPPAPPEYTVEEVALLNSARQARGALKRGPDPKKKQTSKAASLKEIPKCDVCKGGHFVKPCPNVFAKKDNFDARKAEQGNIRCNFRDSRRGHWDVVCGGRGHVAKHH